MTDWFKNQDTYDKIPLMKLNTEKWDNYLFWGIVCLVLLSLTILIRNNSPRCIKYDTVKEKVTYYDFSAYGMGIAEGFETNHFCTQWEKK